MFNKNREGGQASGLILILAIVILIAGIVVYLVMKMAEPTSKPRVLATTPTATPEPVYQKQINDINFVFESAVNKGKVLSISDIVNNDQFGTSQPVNADPGGVFMQVTIGAQNEGRVNTAQDEWDIGNIIDSQGRNFIPLDSSIVGPWISSQNACNVLLRPAFEPVLCTKIYMVSDKSTGLKIVVQNKQKSKTAGSSLLDLLVK